MEEATQEFIKEYFRTNVDVLINWLEFQGSFGFIKGISSFDFSAKVYELKESITSSIEEYLKTKSRGLNTTLVNQIVTKHIIETLQSNGLQDAVNYVLNIKEDKVVELTNALFIRRCVLKSLSRSELIEIEIKDETTKIYKEYLHNLRWLKLESTLEHDTYSEALLTVYMETLPISLNNEKSSYSYIQQVLFYIKRLETLYKEIADNKGLDTTNIEDINEDIDILQGEIDNYMKLNSFFSLVITMDVFNRHITSLKTKIEDVKQSKTLKLV